MEEKIDRLVLLVEQMQGDISEMKQDVSGLKDDVSNLKQDVSGLKQGQAEMKQNMACVLEAVNILQQHEQKHYEELSRRNREIEQLTYMNTLDIAKLRAAR